MAQTSGETTTWQREWRSQVTHDLESSAEKHQQTAIILERLTAHLDATDARVLRLEGRPDRMRADLGTYGGCSSQLLMIAVGAVSTLSGVSGLIIAIISLFHH